MQRTILWLCVGILLLGAVVPILAQQPAAVGSTNQNAVVPPLVSFSGVLNDINNKPLTGVVGVTFALYKDQQGGAPLWLETQNVYPDKTGHYTVNLGSTTNTGLPADIFVAGEARWLGVQAAGQAEQPRVLLLSVPYALKAGDAQTVGGLPVSAFVLAAPPTTGITASPKASAQPLATGTTTVTTAGGTVNQVPLWDSTSDITSSVITQTGSGTTAKIGIGTATPASTLDVKGGATIRGTAAVQGALTLSATGTATATGGKNSQAENFVASVFNSTMSTAVNQKFQWMAEPVANNTANATGSLNLLSASGTATAAETGLKIGRNGQITFAAGQTFPGTGSGTITGVTAGTDMTGGGTSGNVTLNLDLTSTDLRYAQLGTGNTLWGPQTINTTGNGLTVSSGAWTGVLANGSAYGVFANSSTGTAVYGQADQGNGVYGSSNAYAGISGASTKGNGVEGYGATGVLGYGSGAAGVGGWFEHGSGGQALTARVNGVEKLGVFGDKTVVSTTLHLPASATATATNGYNSQALDVVASAYNSGSGQAESQTFRWQSEAVGNNTSSPAGKLNLLFGANGATPAGTGLSVANNGQITFATGQTFPGTGAITEVTAGTDLLGGGSSGNVTLNLDTSKVVTGVIAGSDLTGGGTGGVVTLNLDTSKVPQLGTANTFNASQWIHGSIEINNPSGFGVHSFADYGTGVYGQGSIGVSGTGSGSNGYGVYGSNTTGTGVYGLGITGVYGVSNSGTAVYGTSSSSTGYGVVGNSTSTSGGTGVSGTSASFTGYGVSGVNTSTIASGGTGVFGSGGTGVLGTSSIPTGNGVRGVNSSNITGNAAGVVGSGGVNTGVAAATNASTAYGVVAYNYATSGQAIAVYGITSSGAGYGVYGVSNSSGTGVYGGSSSGTGVYGSGSYGVRGNGSQYGVYGTSGVYNGYGVYGVNDLSGGVGVYGRGAAYSAYFPGNVYIGNLSKNSGSFKIDHPLDPANKYLYHSFVESPDMMNIYNGVVVLDSRGRATVTLPEYFEALNRDFRYQLTAIGTPGPNLYIAKEIANGRFSIAGGKPGAKVSWQVTGIRQDAYANAHRIQVEVEKPPQEQGRYLHPELFGAGPEKAIGVQPPEPSKGGPAQTASLSR